MSPYVHDIDLYLESSFEDSSLQCSASLVLYEMEIGKQNNSL
jgi:hypothetical protein